MLRMVRHLDVEEPHGRRRDYIDALLQHRRPRVVDDASLLKRIESKTAQHRSPYSANISRKHASILAAMSPPGAPPPKGGHRRSMTPTREASTRRAFEVFEWDRDFEPMEEPKVVEAITPREDVWDTPPEPRPSMMRPMAGMDDEEEDEAPEAPGTPPAGDEEEPETIPEAEDLVDEGILEDLRALASPGDQPPAETDEGSGAEEEPSAEEQEPVVETTDEVIVEGRPGHSPREGGEFPVDLMDPLDEAEPETVARLDRPSRGEEVRDVTVLTYEHETDMTDDQEASPGETETNEAVMGLVHAKRWPSDTGLELHIDGFEHMAATSDLCPRCGRRVTARNRLLTCNDCGAVACESCEIRTSEKVDSPYYYDWHFELPLCVNCYEKAYNIQKMLAKAKGALGMGNHTYAYYHAQQALKTDPASPYAEEARRIISQVDRRRRESAEQDEAWKRQRAKMSRTSVVRED